MTSDYGAEGQPGAPASTSFAGGTAGGGGAAETGGGPTAEPASPADREAARSSASRAGADGTTAAQGSATRPPRVAGTRTSHTWVALAAGLFFLIVVLVFILQNLKSVKAHFFWATWSIPLAVDLLLAAVLGALIMFTAGSLRIVQLRRAARRRG